MRVKLPTLKGTILVITFFVVCLLDAIADERRNPSVILAVDKNKIELGRKLFFDMRLGVEHDGGCVSCHQPWFGWADRSDKSLGAYGRPVTRNAPTIIGVAHVEKKSLLFRDGRAKTLEEQISNVVNSAAELDLSPGKLEERVRELREYEPLLKQVYGSSEVTVARITGALAAFVRTLDFAESDFSRFLKGERQALNTEEQRGYKLFTGRLGCAACHAGPRLTDDSLRAIGTGRSVELGGSGDPGREAITGEKKDRGAFRVPSLLNVALTPPYFHDGSAASLEEVVSFYENEFFEGVNVDPERRVLRITDSERTALLAFLYALDAGAEPVLYSEWPLLPTDVDGTKYGSY